MKIAHLVPRRSTKWHPQTTRQQPGARTALNVLNQAFQADAPNEKWVSDITYIATQEGWLYLASILDLYSRRIVGWAMEETMEVSLVEKAWQMALLNRHPLPQLLHHSDRGSQYTSEAYQKLLRTYGITVSMSGTGNCYDNAMMESFFSTLRAELTDLERFPTRQAARAAVFEFIEVFYNRKRLHSAIGYCSPEEFEQQELRMAA